MKKGEVIRCKDVEEIVDIDHGLNLLGYTTNFLYQHNGEHGLFIEIIEEPKELK